MASSPRPKENSPKDLLEWLGLSEFPNWKVARPLGALFGVCLALLFALALAAAFWAVIKTFVPPSEIVARNPGNSLGSGALLVAILGAPFLIWNSIIKHRALGFQKEGHITDRIARAVEQLGVEKTVKLPGEGVDANATERTFPNIEVRIGGILSLERIAQDSVAYDKGRDHIQIMEILCAYVRENASNKVGQDARTFEKIPEPRNDIQTAMKVIARRSIQQVQLEASRGYRLNFNKCDLSKVNLQKGKFAGALFTGSCLDGADFGCTDLTGTRVNRCSVNQTIFWDAKIHGTHFSFSKATEPTHPLFSAFTPNNFSCAFIEGADLSYARLPDAVLKGSLTFGSQDTILANGLDQSKNKMLAVVQSRALATDLKDEQPQANTASDDELTSSGFLYWTYLGATDGGNGQFYDRFRQTHSLFGWPHTDN